MKIKKGSLLTVILAMLCALAVALGVGFMLPKNEIKVARAAGGFDKTSLKVDTSTIVNKCEQRYAQDASFNVSDLGAGAPASGTASFTDTSITYSEASASKDSTLAYFSFKVGIKVPAWEEYKVSFDIALSVTCALTGNGCSYVNWPAGIFFCNPNTNDPDFAPQTDFSSITLSTGTPIAVSDSDIQSKTVYNTTYIGGSSTTNKTLSSGDWKLRNESDTEKAYTFDLAVTAGCPATSTANGAYSQMSNFSMTLQNTSVERKAIVPLTTDKETGDFAAATMATYTGSTIDFDLHYCHIYAAPTAVTGVDVDGGALATPVTLAGNVNTTTGKFTATLAGTYVVTFNLTSAAATDGIPWSDDSYGIQTLTFTINQKEVTLPTFSGTHSYNGSAQDFGFANYDKKEVTITGVEVKPNGGSTTTLTSIGTSSRADGSVYPVSWEDSNSNYPVTLDDSASIVKVSATDAGEYKLTFDLVDKKNYKWAPGVASDKKVSFTMERAPLTVTFGAPGSSTNFSWKLGDFSTTPGYLTVDSINGIKNSENVTVDLYWYSDSNKSAINPMYMTGVPDSTKYDVSQFDSFGVGTYYLCAVLANDKTGNNVNRNYKISTNDTNVTPQKNEVAVQKIVINAGTASVDDVKWQYQTAAMADPADYTGATLTYDKVSGNPVVYTMSITGIPNTWTATYGQNYSKSDADTYTAKVTIEIPAAEQANSKFPDPSAMSYTYGGEGNYKYISDSKCEITFDWTIEKKEVDLSAVAFEYTTDGWQSYATYSSTNPPEGDGATTYFEVRFPLTSLTNIGVTGTPTVSNYGNQFGPGDVTFDVDFTLDGNHKAKSGQNEHQMTYTMKTTGKKLAVKWKRVQLTDSNGDPVKDSLGMPYYVYELDTTDLPADALQYIKYEYYTDNGGTIGSLISGGSDVVNHKSFDYIINPTGMNANSQNPKQVFVKVVLDNVPMMGPANDVPQYVFDTTGDPSDKRITVGDNRKAVDVTATTVTSMTYKGSVNIADAYEVAINTPHVVLQPNQYTVALYLGADLINADATAQDYSQLDAGKYTLKFTLASSMDAQYALTSDSLSFEIKPKEITVPTVKAGVTFTFNGLDQQLEAQLDGWDDTYMEWDLASVHEAYHANKYTAIIKLKDEFVGNYIFVLPNDNGKALGKKAVKALVDGEENLPVLSGDKTTATIPWKIEKYVYDTTTKNAWNFTKDGASLSFNGVPATIKALTLGDNPRLVFETAYFDLDGNPLTGEITIKGGDKYKVAAYLDPNCADANDIEFKGQAYDPMLQMTTSPQAAYTVPKSASAAFLGNLKDAMTKVYAGLPLWAWLLIALALLILLIIIIVVACKRRKTKEEKEEIKARKEEERLRKEEEKQRREEEREAERQRREEERRLQQEKLEAERELAKAKQEAELEKIRAQVQAQAGAGMATMAVQQQPQQQIPPQPVQQVQSVDNELLKEMRQQMAELRADNKATQAQLQAMQNNQQQQQPMQMPMPQPMYQQYPQYPMYQQMPMGMPNYGGGNDMALARMEAQLNAMQAEQRARYDAEQRIELAAMRAEQHVDRDSRHSVDLAAMREHINGYNYNRIPDYSNQAYNQQPNSVEALGAIVAAALKNISTPAPAQPVAELPQQTEASAPSEVRYPSDAVITTTTTVDTTKNKPITRERDDGRIFDSDGFYDPLE